MRTLGVTILFTLVVAGQAFGISELFSDRSSVNLFGNGHSAVSGHCESRPPLGITRLRLGHSDLFGRATFELSGGTGFVTGAVHDYRLKGLWAELNQVVPLSDTTNLVLLGSYLFPSTEYVSEDYQLMLGLRYRTLWTTKTQLWTVGAAVSHRFAGPLSLVAGYSFNSFDMSFKSLESASGLFPAGFVTPQSSVEVDAHTPFLGLMTEFQSSASSMSVGVLCCPVFIGDLNYSVAAPPPGGPSSAYGPFRHTYFAGLVGEYSQTFSLGHVGVFGRWLGIPGAFDLSFQGAPIKPSTLRIKADFWVVGVQAVIAFGI